jgi:hypothetical protein
LGDSAFNDGEFFTAGVFYGKVFMDSVGLLAAAGSAAIKGAQLAMRASGATENVVTAIVRAAEESSSSISMASRRGPGRLVDFPEPMAGRDYLPAELASANPAIRASHRNGYLAELEQARSLHFNSAGADNVLAYGRASGARYADIVSFNSRTGEVTLWDVKFRSSSGGYALPQVASKPAVFDAWARDARAIVQQSELSMSDKVRALESIDSGSFNIRVTPAGAADRGYFWRGTDLLKKWGS